jgi:Chlorophyllase enzyme
MHCTSFLILTINFVDLSFAQVSSSSNGLISLLANLIPGVVTSSGGLDVAASVCETFKPGNAMGAALASVFGSPYYGNQTCEKDTSGGSGQFKANYVTDPTLPSHTIYAPKSRPPASEKLPVIIWGNGACLAIGTMFQNFLTEVASHGFLVVANGEPVGLSMTNYRDLITSIDWVTSNPAAKKYGNIDLGNIAIAGQSCGGMEAYSASFNTTKHKLTILFNSGFLNPSDAGKISQMKKPIAYFLGGKTDMATSPVRGFNNSLIKMLTFSRALVITIIFLVQFLLF